MLSPADLHLIFGIIVVVLAALYFYNILIEYPES